MPIIEHHSETGMPADRIVAYGHASTNEAIRHDKTRKALTAVCLIYYCETIRYAVRGKVWSRSAEYAMALGILHLLSLFPDRRIEFALRGSGLISRLSDGGELDTQRKANGRTTSGTIPEMYEELCRLKDNSNLSLVLLKDSAWGEDTDLVKEAERIAKKYKKSFDKKKALTLIDEWEEPRTGVIAFND